MASEGGRGGAERSRERRKLEVEDRDQSMIFQKYKDSTVKFR
jgi:hypothetical protein